jgi:flagellar protein FliO/FliZ
MFGVAAQAAALVAFAGAVTNATALSTTVGTAVTNATALSTTVGTTITNAAALSTAVGTAATNATTLSTAVVTAVSGATTLSPVAGTAVTVADAPAAPATSRPFAAPQAVTTPTAPTAGGLAQVTFALLLVLVAIFAVAWVARRMRGFNNRVGDAIDVLADIPLGQKERAVLLKVGHKQILVGVAPGRVNTLHVLEEPLDLKKPTAGPTDSRPNFKQLMLRSLGK